MFAVILLSKFKLQAALRFREGLQQQPVALIDGQEPKSGLLDVNDVAAAAGVTVGQTSTQGLARCGALRILARSLAEERSAQAVLLEIAASISPEVEATAEGFCTVNLEGSPLRDWQTLGAGVVARLGELRLNAQVGIGLNPDLAFLAARRARPVLVVQSPVTFLCDLAVSELDPAPELLAVLRDWGIHNLAQLTSLPRGELMDRLGCDAARLWERAAGRMERPLRLVREAEQFEEAFDFEREIETVEPLLFMLRRLLDQLVRRLGNAYRVAGRMTLTLPLANGAAHERLFTVPSPTASVDVLFRILQTHLDGLRLDHAATGARLRIEPTYAERQQFQLFESPLRDPNRFGETLGRLAALVGSENVGVVEILDTHRPDSFRLRTPHFHDPGPTLSPEDFTIGLPLRRWRPAISAEVRMVQHRPTFVDSGKVRGAIRDALGPYRASGGWWESDCWSTEEWDIELEAGGLYRLARNGQEWRIEGSYDEPAPGTEQIEAIPFIQEKGGHGLH
jgi:protein ImuB